MYKESVLDGRQRQKTVLDSAARSLLEGEKRDREEERGRLRRLQETSWKEVQGARVWFEKQGVLFQTGFWSKQGSQWGLWDAWNANFLHERPNQNFRSCCDTLSLLHQNIFVLWLLIQRSYGLHLSVRQNIDSARQHSAGNRCGSTSCI